MKNIAKIVMSIPKPNSVLADELHFIPMLFIQCWHSKKFGVMEISAPNNAKEIPEAIFLFNYMSSPHFKI